MKKRNKLKYKLLSLLCSIGALNGASNSRTHGDFLKFVGGFNTLSKGLSNLATVGWGVKSMIKAQQHNNKNRKFPWNPELCPELFEKYDENETIDAAGNKVADPTNHGFTTTFDDAMSLMVGRTKQKEILRKLSIKHLVKNVMHIKNNISVVMAYGQSGTGKSQLIDYWERLFIANGFGNSLSNMPKNPPGPCRIRPADIDFSNKKVSFWNQLLENKKMTMGTDVPIQSELVAYIEANPDGGIIDIDEADKFMDKSVQEGLRSIIDEGVLRADGIAYPLNNYIIVIKGNMSPSSVFGTDDLLSQNDIQTGLTSIDISQSLTKRIELVPFEAYSAPELFSIFMSRLTEWKEKYTNVGLQINIPDETKKKLGKFLTNNQMQGRGADKLYEDLTPQLYYIERTISSNRNKNRQFIYNLFFDEDSEALYLEDASNLEEPAVANVSELPTAIERETNNKSSKVLDVDDDPAISEASGGGSADKSLGAKDLKEGESYDDPATSELTKATAREKTIGESSAVLDVTDGRNAGTNMSDLPPETKRGAT